MDREQLIREFWKVAKNTERGEHYTRALNHVIDLCEAPCFNYRDLAKRLYRSDATVDNFERWIREFFEPKKYADDYSLHELRDLLRNDSRPDHSIVAWIMGDTVEHASKYYRFVLKVRKGWTVEEASAYMRSEPFKTNPNKERWHRARYVVTERMKHYD